MKLIVLAFTGVRALQLASTRNMSKSQEDAEGVEAIEDNIGNVLALLGSDGQPVTQEMLNHMLHDLAFFEQDHQKTQDHINQVEHCLAKSDENLAFVLSELFLVSRLRRQLLGTQKGL